MEIDKDKGEFIDATKDTTVNQKARYDNINKEFFNAIKEPQYKDYLKNKLKEKSTWLGVITLLFPLIQKSHGHLIPEDFVQFGAMSLGAFLVILNENRKS